MARIDFFNRAWKRIRLTALNRAPKRIRLTALHRAWKRIWPTALNRAPKHIRPTALHRAWKRIRLTALNRAPKHIRPPALHRAPKRIRPTAVRRAWKCVRTPAAVLAGIVVVGLLVKGPPGCGGGPAERHVTQAPPPARQGVPSIGVLLTASPISQARLAGSGRFLLTADRQAASDADEHLAGVLVSRIGGAWRVDDRAIQAGQLTLSCPPDGFVSLDGKVYRGSLELLADGPGRFIVVNRIDMESYLAGVLAKELYPAWQPETYRAQAIAARTFAMYHVMTGRPGRRYNLGSGQAAQVYGGVAGETPKAWQAVRATHGQVLAWGAPGHEKIFMAQYSACCGGRTNPAAVIRDAQDIPPLRGGQVCTGCAASSRYRWQPVRITKADAYRALAAGYRAVAALGGLAELRVAKQNRFGRIVWLDVVAPDGRSVRLRAEDVRLALMRNHAPGAAKLYSANCKIRDLGDSIEFYDGRGFGHGVGMCQWGAEHMAVGGADHIQILSFYYPQAKIIRAY